MILAGDAISPSVLGTARVDGKPIAGAQMIAMLNAVGLDYATFGNHEFDFDQDVLMARIRESRFPWFSGNVRQADGEPFPGVRQNVVFTVDGSQGGHVRIGLIGVTLDDNKKPWVKYNDILQTAREQVTNLRGQGVDVVVAVTHETYAQDVELANKVPGIDLIIGGHEHENIEAFRGPSFVPILKADANLRSAYVHYLVYDTESKKLKIDSHLVRLNESVAQDPAIAKLAEDWSEKGFAAFRKNGFNPTEVIANSPEALEGKDAQTRNHPTNLSDTIATAFLHAFPQAEAAFFNTGSIRIDDDLPAGPITQYDVLRVLPFGGKMVLTEMKGSLLTKILNIGQDNKGSGGYLAVANLAKDASGSWLIQGAPVDPNRTYKIVTSDFLLTGREKNLGFLLPTNPEISKVTDGPEVRMAVMKEFKSRWPAK
jgi:5'-nucleotidase